MAKKGLRYHLSTRNKSGKLPPFVPVIWEMLNSKSYKNLSFSASKALIYFSGKPKKKLTHQEYYNVDFEFTYTEAKNLGFKSSRTWIKIIIELVEKGFVDPVRKGGLRGDGKSSNKFRMSTRWMDYGTPEFKAKKWEQYVQQSDV